MTLVVPLHLLNALDEAALSWLAPGFMQEKAAALIKSLPKALRRNFVPAPDFARAFAEAHREPDADAMPSALARFLKKLSGVDLSAVDFDEADIDAHLRMNLQLQDESGKQVLAHSRDLSELRKKYGDRAQRAFASRAAKDMARTGLLTFPDVAIALQIIGDGGIPAYPALQDDGETVSLQVHAQRSTAERLHPQGVRRLLRLALTDKFKQARRQLPIPAKIGLLYAALEHAPSKLKQFRKPVARDADQLREDLVEGAFAALATDARLTPIRDLEVFNVEAEGIAKTLFSEAMRRLQQAESILSAVAEVRAGLESKLMGWASGNLDDMRAHLDSLAAPGFLRETPAAALAELPRYLKALSLRAERAQRDPQKDQARMLELKPFVDALAEGDASSIDMQDFRWDLEELRVATYAQELGVKGSVSAKKLASRIARMREA